MEAALGSDWDSGDVNGADVAATLPTVIESCKKASLQPKEYLKYLITERWHKRQPISPLGRNVFMNR